jgi:SAM-dependent methyltransferase
VSNIGPATRLIARRAYLAVRRTLSRVVIERRYGIETAKEADLADLGLDDQDRVRYEPSGWLDLRRILRPHEVTEDDVFIDLGSGKGRVLLAAARYPFGRIIGVELSPRLTEIAAANLHAARDRLLCSDVELVTSDVLDYELPTDVTVVYLYNPFRGPVFQAVVDKLIDSVDRYPRPVRVIYRTPLEQSVLLSSGRFELVRSVPGLRPGRAWSQKMATEMYRISAPPPIGDGTEAVT